MKAKSIFLWMLLLLLVGGVNCAWAETYTVKFSGGAATQSTDNWFTISGAAYGSNYKGTYGGESYTNALKVVAATNISFTTTVASTVTIVQCISRSDDGNGPLKFDNTALTESQQTATEDGVYVEYTLTGVAAGSHSITRGDSQTGLFMVKVEEETFTMEVNTNDLYYATAAYVGTSFTYCGEYSFRIKLNLNQDLQSSDFSTSYFSVTTSNASVISVDNYSVGTVNNNANRIFIYVTTKGVGTATLTFTYNGGGTYSNTATCSQEFTLTAPSFAVFNNSSPSYPFTWDFVNNDWTSSKIQTKNNTTTWNYSDNEARAKDASGISANNNIDMINGLAFSSVANTSPCLDWKNRQLWLQASTTITLPTLSAGQIVTLSSTGSFATPTGTTKVGENTFRVTADNTTVTLTVPSGDCYLYSIKVSSAGQATYETTTDGVFQFTGTGSLDGGTVIKDVPGIEAIIGSVGDTWNIWNQNQNGYYTGYVGSGSDRDKTFIVFSPSVNGFLTIEGTFFGLSSHIYIDELETNTHVFDSSGERIITAQTCSTPLVAGKTYKLYGGFYASQFHGFSYRPAFLTPDNTAEQTSTYSVYSSETSFPMLVSEYTSGVTFTSSNTSAATVTEHTGWPTYVSAGSTTITGTVTSPNSAVNSKTATYTLTFQEANIASTLAFTTLSPSAINYVTYGSDMTGHSTFTNAISSSSPAEALTGATITYSSSDESIATVDGSGNLSIYNNGTVTITATMAAHGAYTESSQTYTLTINPTVDSDLRFDEAGPIIIPYGNSHTNKGVVYANNVAHPEAWVGYSSSNASIATVDADGLVSTIDRSSTDDENTITITAWSPAYKQYKAAQNTYIVKVSKNVLPLTFAPNGSGTVNVGNTITPYLGIGSVHKDKLGALTATSSDAAIATVTNDLKSNWQLNAEDHVHKLNPVMTGVAVGEVTITVTLAANQYYEESSATYKLKVNASGTQNFSWEDATASIPEPEYKVFEGDFMIMPMIKGNSNSNNNYSDASKNKYAYSVSTSNSSPSSLSDFSITWNSNDYRRYEGIPDFEIRNSDRNAVSDKAIIFQAKGEGGRTGEKPDTLMIYALPLGASANQTVYIRAYEPADHTKFCDAKLTIMPKSTLTTAHTTDVNSVTYPYTWDFTKDFSASATAITSDNVYWAPIKNRPGTYQAGGGFFNIKSYAKPSDKTYDPKNSNIYFQNFVANGSTLPQFKGLMVSINGTSSWGNKVERLQVTPKAGEGNSHLYFNGGYHELILPDVSTSKIVPDNYKVIIKVKSNGSGKVTCIQGSYSEEKSFGKDAPSILDFNVTKTGGQILLRFNNAHVYWIATSTEAKPVEKGTNTTYPAATYSYPEDLDFALTSEANSAIGQLTAYYADGFTDNTVHFTPVPASKAKSNTGLVLKGADNEAGGNFYMVANARNVESYTSPGDISATNYLKATTNGQTIDRFEGSGESEKTNYVLASHYFRVYEDDFGTVEGSEGDYEWRFVRVNGTFSSVPSKLAYLQVPGHVRNIGSEYEESVSPARLSLLNLSFDEMLTPSDVKSVGTSNASADDGDWYTLQGVRVDVPKKGGLYIHKGRKVVVK